MNVSGFGLGYVGEAVKVAEALTRTRPDHVIIDLVRPRAERSEIAGDYRGMCW